MTEGILFVQSKDGTSIACHVSGSGAPLVLVYGALSDHTYWRRLEPFLGGFELHAMERRGRGLSGDSAVYTVENEVDDVAAVIESVGAPALVFAHSAGAVLALLAARRAPASVRRLVLYEPPLVTGGGVRPPVSADLPARLAQLTAAGQPDAAIETFFREAPGLPEEEIARQKGGALWRSLVPLAGTAAYDARIGIEFDLTELADPAFAVPTLLLYGEVGPAWVTAGVRALAPRLGNARLRLLPGQGHAAAFTAPELLADEMRAFFAKA